MRLMLAYKPLNSYLKTIVETHWRLSISAEDSGSIIDPEQVTFD
jgi:hypothetical protein